MVKRFAKTSAGILAALLSANMAFGSPEDLESRLNEKKEIWYPLPVKSPEKKEFNMDLHQLINYYGITEDAKHNREIITNLTATEFHLLRRKISFDGVRDLIGRNKCDEYASGYKRVENLRKLVPLINKQVHNRNKISDSNVSSWRVLGHIGTESGGDNELNCEEGGGVMHLLQRYHGNGINLLNIEQNLYKGIEYISELNEEFEDKKTSVLAYNIGDSRVRKIRNDIAGYLKYEKGIENPNISYEQIMWMLEQKESRVAEAGRKYVNRYENFLEKIKKENLFSWDKEKNMVRYIGPEEGISLDPPRPSRK